MHQKPHHRRRQWENILRKQQQSGLSVSQFCRQETLSVSNFYNWRSRLGLSNSTDTAAIEAANSFVDLGQLNSVAQTVSCVDAERWELELNLGNGMTLKFRQL